MYRTAFINGCIKVENSVASIYSGLMQAFPEKKDFWESLLRDEKRHVAFLTDVKSLGLFDEIEKVDLLPAMPVIEKALKLAEGVNEKIKSRSLIFNEALSETLKVEESMVETYTNKIIAHLLSCANESSCQEIIADEKSHVEKIKMMMAA